MFNMRLRTVFNVWGVSDIILDGRGVMGMVAGPGQQYRMPSMVVWGGGNVVDCGREKLQNMECLVIRHFVSLGSVGVSLSPFLAYRYEYSFQYS